MLVFEQFNLKELDLSTMIGDVRGMDSLTDEKIQEINHQLLVSSFQGFLDKIHPTVIPSRMTCGLQRYF